MINGHSYISHHVPVFRQQAMEHDMGTTENWYLTGKVSQYSMSCLTFSKDLNNYVLLSFVPFSLFCNNSFSICKSTF